MWNNHVLNVDRPSKRSTPRTTASQVSWTTSSATERLDTTRLRQSLQARLVHANELDECGLVTCLEAFDEFPVVGHGHAGYVTSSTDVGDDHGVLSLVARVLVTSRV